MPTHLQCPSCGAPLRYRGDAPVVECRYCRTNVATGTGQITQQQAVVRSRMRPRNQAAIVLLAFGLPVVGVVLSAVMAVVAGGSGGGPGGSLARMHASELAGLSMGMTIGQMAEATGADPSSDTDLCVWYRGSVFDYTCFRWDEEHPEHVQWFGFYAGEDDPPMPAVAQWMQHHLGRRLAADEEGNLYYRWGGTWAHVTGDGHHISAEVSPDEDPDWAYRMDLLWSVALASTNGQDLGLDDAARRRWLATGYGVGALGAIDVTMDVDQALKQMPARFPGAVAEQMIGLEYDIPLDHPWFGQASMEWENEAGGRLDDTDLWPPPGLQKFPNQGAIRACLEKTYGPAEVDVTDHLAGTERYEWDPDGIGWFTLHDHLLAIYAYGWRDEPPTKQAWARLMGTLDACGR